MTDDMDLHRDAASAFGPDSLTASGLLPYEGRAHLLGPDGPPSGVFAAEQDGWLTPDNPILVRGAAKILPLAWRGDPRSGHHPYAEPGQIAAFASRMQSAGMHWAGSWTVLDLADRRPDSIGSYTAALRDAGATRVNCWRYSETVGFSLVWSGVEDKGTMSLALHVVPASWVREPRSWVSKRDARAWRPVHGIDVRWSWAEVIALYESRMRGIEDVDLSEAIVVYLAHYPGKNEEEFLARFGTGPAHYAVREILDETMRIRIDWGEKPLVEIGDEVERVMHERHPELSAAALHKLRNYFTYLVK